MARPPTTTVHEPLTAIKRLTHGIFVSERAIPTTMGEQPVHRMQFDSDGDVSVRFAQRHARLLKDQYYGILLTGYYAAQKTFRHFGTTSQANVAFRSALDGQATRENVPQHYAEQIVIDLARQKFADAFAEMVLRLFRVVNIDSTLGIIRGELQRYADAYIADIDALPDEWTAAP